MHQLFCIYYHAVVFCHLQISSLNAPLELFPDYIFNFCKHYYEHVFSLYMQWTQPGAFQYISLGA